MRKFGRFLFGFLAVLTALILPSGWKPEYVVSPIAKDDGVTPESRRQGHDLAEPPPKWIALSVAGLFCTIICIMFLLHWLHTTIRYKHPEPVVTQYQQSFQHAPYSETDIARAWKKIDEATKRNLETYHWVDRKSGLVGIPIARAMQLIVTEGLPARAGRAPAFPSPTQEMKPIYQTEKVDEITQSH